MYDKIDDWTMEEESLDIILAYIKENKPKVIVELGSGKSTKKIAESIDYLCDFYSYEGKEEWYKKTKKMLKFHDLTLIYSPYQNREDGTLWFDEKDFKMDQIDLLIIDAPEGINGKLSRMIPESIKKKTNVAFLHDCNREEEILVANKLGRATFYLTKWGLAKIEIC